MSKQPTGPEKSTRLQKQNMQKRDLLLLILVASTLGRGQPLECPPNFAEFQDSAVSTTTICIPVVPLVDSPCNPGSFAHNETHCMLCPPGTYRLPDMDSNKCEPCPAGTYCSSSLGSEAYTACPMGTYSSTKGAISSDVCVQCPAGKYAPIPALTVCLDCSLAGYVNPHAGVLGMSKCVLVPLDGWTEPVQMVA